MHILLTIIIILVAIVVIILLAALQTRKNHYVKQNILINASQQEIFNFFEVFKKSRKI
jgi:uncharacterized protein YxeA